MVTASLSLYAGPAPAECLVTMWSAESKARANCLDSMREERPSEVRVAALADAITTATPAADGRSLAGLLDIVRTWDVNSDLLTAAISRTMLEHGADAMQGRDKTTVIRIRAYAFAALAQTGVPNSVVPLLVDALAYADERMTAKELGAAARAAGALGEKGHDLVDFLLRPVGEIMADEEFSLERYDLPFPPDEATTLHIEIAHALGNLANASDAEALDVLSAIAGSAPGQRDPRFVASAADALRAVLERTPSLASEPAKVGATTVGATTVTPWLPPEERSELPLLDIGLTDHDGRSRIFRALTDRPTLFTFFFTGCEFGRCPITVAQLAGIQEELRQLDLGHDVRILAISLQPDFETPDDLRRYATERGLDLGEHAMAIKLDPARHMDFLDGVETSVGYSAGWVTSHGVEAILLDAHGRLVRKYSSLALVENETIISDLQALLAGS